MRQTASYRNGVRSFIITSERVPTGKSSRRHRMPPGSKRNPRNINRGMQAGRRIAQPATRRNNGTPLRGYRKASGLYAQLVDDRHYAGNAAGDFLGAIFRRRAVDGSR
jgi:hypothetical protein